MRDQFGGNNGFKRYKRELEKFHQIENQKN